jgi:hypothetical protein
MSLSSASGHHEEGRLPHFPVLLTLFMQRMLFQSPLPLRMMPTFFILTTA